MPECARCHKVYPDMTHITEAADGSVLCNQCWFMKTTDDLVASFVTVGEDEYVDPLRGEVVNRAEAEQRRLFGGTISALVIVVWIVLALAACGVLSLGRSTMGTSGGGSVQEQRFPWPDQ